MDTAPTTKQLETAYALAKDRYAGLGVDTEAALDALGRIALSLHCWQGDDVGGFEAPDAALGGGLAATGTLDFISEFAVTLIDGAGTRRTFKRDGDVPKVVVTDPLQVHFDMLRTFNDKDMQDLTAYLWTLK